MPDGVQFNEQQISTTPSYYSSEPKGMAGWLVKKGFAKDQKGANVIMLILTALFFGTTLFLIFSGGSSTPPPLPEGEIPADVPAGP